MAIKDINGSSGPAPSTMDLFTSAAADAAPAPAEETPTDDSEPDESLDGDFSEEGEEEVEEQPEGEEQEEVAEVPSYKFKADGQEFDVKLTPDDQNTQNLLKWGAIGKRLMSERDKARDDSKSRDKEIKSLKAELADKQAIAELKEAGFIDRAIMRAIGVDEYKAFMDKAYNERLERDAQGEDATASKLRELEDSKRFVEYESAKERKRIEEEREARLIADETARIDSTFQQMFAKYNFSKLGVKPELAEKYNQRLFRDAKLAVQEAAELLAKGESLSPQMIEQAFKSSRQELAALIGQAADSKADKQVQKMKADAKTKAGAISKTNYGSGAKKQDFTGMSMAQVVKKLTGRA